MKFLVIFIVNCLQVTLIFALLTRKRLLSKISNPERRENDVFLSLALMKYREKEIEEDVVKGFHFSTFH